jgi:hypothetical protein
MQALNAHQEAGYRLALSAAHAAIGLGPSPRIDPLGVDWAYFLYFVDLNGLSGAVHAAFAALSDDERARVPFRVGIAIRNEAERYRERWTHHQAILSRLDERADDGLTIVLLKGASFKSTIYAPFPDVRVMGDVDLLVSSDHSDEVVSWVEAWGYRTRESKNGITAIGNAGGRRTVIDVHIDDPAKTRRNPSRSIRTLLANRVPSPIYPNLWIPRFEYSMAHACKHFCEHKDDFRKILFQDDIKIGRLLDILLLERVCDEDGVRTIAAELDWLEELERTQRYLEPVRPDCPASAQLPETVATAVGDFVWPFGFESLLKRTDRAEWLSARMGEGGARDLWYSPEKGILKPSTTSA